MAEVTYRIDDLDGKTKVNVPTTVLTLNGRTVTIDLSEKHVEELVGILAPYFDKGIVSEKKAKTANGNADSQDRNAEIRTWAIANGHNVSERGRLPGAVVRAYEEYEASQNGSESSAA